MGSEMCIRDSFESVEAIPWTLDGEYGGTHEEVVIKNKNQALQIMVKEEAVEDRHICEGRI